MNVTEDEVDVKFDKEIKLIYLKNPFEELCSGLCDFFYFFIFNHK